MLDKNGIAKRIAREVKDGYYVNLGIGIPTLVANFVRSDISVEFQSENGRRCRVAAAYPARGVSA